MTSAPWFDAMRRESVLSVASAHGFDVAPPRGSSGGVVYKCPACEVQRERRSQRHVYMGGTGVGVRKGGNGWRCFSCGASGDAIDFAAYTLAGNRYKQLGLVDRLAVGVWCRAFVGAAPSVTYVRPAAVVQLPVQYPPADEVHELWARCTPVTRETADYLRSRNVRPELVLERDTARALPDSRNLLPQWARSWRASGHRLIVPVFDHSGAMRSVLARSVERAPKLKSLAPKGFGRAGLVMADGMAQEILRNGQRPPRFGDAELWVIVAEGEIDYLTAVQLSAAYPVATFSVVSGSWTREIAARIPGGAIVVAATDPDPAGDRYAQQIFETFSGRPSVKLRRWRHPMANAKQVQP